MPSPAACNNTRYYLQYMGNLLAVYLPLES